MFPKEREGPLTRKNRQEKEGEVQMKKFLWRRNCGKISYPGRGIVIGRSRDGKKAVAAYFIMGRSENSRNRVFVEEGEGIRTEGL